MLELQDRPFFAAKNEEKGHNQKVLSEELVKVVLFASGMLNDFDALKLLSEISVYIII